MAVSAQVDLSTSAFSTFGAFRTLLQSASVDDVQPIAVMVMESLGSRMVVDRRLIPPAVDALGGDKPWRSEQIKLCFGLSSGGIAARIRESPSAVSVFLLITALSQSMDTQAIGDVLLEILIESGIVQEASIGPSQVQKLVEILLGNSKLLLQRGYMGISVFEPISIAVQQYANVAKGFFQPMDARSTAKVLLQIIDGLRDEAIGKILVTGNLGGVTIIGVLRWLFPNEVEVLSNDGNILAPAENSPAKLTITLSSRGESSKIPWRVETWDTISSPDEVFQTPSGTSNDRIGRTSDKETSALHGEESLPTLVPIALLYSYQHTIPSTSYEHLALSANLAIGLVLAASTVSRVTRNDQNGAVLQSLPFSEICSPGFHAHCLSFPLIFGCPKSSIDFTIFSELREYFSKNSSRFFPQIGNEKLFAEFAKIKVATKDRLRIDGYDELHLRDLWNFATQMADLALLAATHEDPTAHRLSLPPIVPWRENEIIHKLLGLEKSIDASEYLQSALLAVHGHHSTPASDPLIAISGNGHVCLLSSFIRTPRRPYEAFQITVKPGQARWRNSPIQYLYQCELQPVPSFEPNPTPIFIHEIMETHPKSLRIRDHAPFKFFMKTRPEQNAASLMCIAEGRIQLSSQFIKALINWAMATRVRPSGRTLEELLVALEKEGVTSLYHKHPNSVGMHYQPEYPDQTRAVATYNDREELQFLNFGTIDMLNINAIIQGRTPLLDCAVQALQMYGAGWILMSNPYT